MKVKITKTINMDQIPTEVRRMVDQAKNTIVYGLPEIINEVVYNCISSRGEVFFKTIDSIDSARKELAALDESLQEIQNILVGYKNALMPPEQEQEEENDQEWADQEEAEFEKRASQHISSEEVEYEEG